MMQIHTKNIYKPKNCLYLGLNRKYKTLQCITIALALLLGVPMVNTADTVQPRKQNFVLTGYYSPIEGQCCYVKGGIEADKILNGEGHTAADGTPVYPGLIAAPGTYPFGTVVELPGLGVFKVHDRGGAILEWDNGQHRLDIWMGFGEEGLARALQLGLEEISGTVYPPGSNQPEVSFNFDAIAAPQFQLERFKVSASLLTVSPEKEQSGLSVSMLQEHLHTLGYLDESPTGYFGEKTQTALQNFLTDFKINEPSDRLTTNTAAHVLAAVVRKTAQLPLTEFIDAAASPQAIIDAQRILSSVGYFNGRKDGKYSTELQAAILQFQQDNLLVGDVNSPGASRIGPVTKRSLEAMWNRKLVHSLAQKYLTYATVHETLKVNGTSVQSFLEEGSFGTNVQRLQQYLADLGYFDGSQINGNFGPATKKAVIDYQLHNTLISSASDKGAGVVGPNTLSYIQRMQTKSVVSKVRSYGFEIL